MLGIIGALDVEVAAIRSALGGTRLVTVLGIDITIGELLGQDCALVRCGVGKVNAALATAALSTLPVSGIIFTGMAGGIGGPGVGAAVVATDFVQHDVDATALGYAPGSLLGEPASWPADPVLSDALAGAAGRLGVAVHRGRIASGDQFVASAERSAWIGRTFGAIAVEMEGAATAQAANRLGLPLAVLRWISDTADHAAVLDFPAFTAHIAELDLAVLRELLAQPPLIAPRPAPSAST